MNFTLSAFIDISLASSSVLIGYFIRKFDKRPILTHSVLYVSTHWYLLNELAKNLKSCKTIKKIK